MVSNVHNSDDVASQSTPKESSPSTVDGQIVATFASRNEAESAVKRLVEFQVPQEMIVIEPHRTEHAESDNQGFLSAGVLSRGLSFGVLGGGIFGMVAILFFTNALASTIMIAICMVSGAALGLILSISRGSPGQSPESAISGASAASKYNVLVDVEYADKARNVITQ